jgi:hypothetical protein
MFAMSIDPRDIAAALRQEFGIDDLPPMEPVQKFAILVLWKAQMDGSRDVIVEAVNSGGVVPIRYMVDGAWYEMSPFPAPIRSQFKQAIMDMAGLARGTNFPCQGQLDNQVSPKMRLRWTFSVAANDGPLHFWQT